MRENNKEVTRIQTEDKETKPNSMKEINNEFQLPSGFVRQRKILYYSDFDIDVSVWESEQERLKFFADKLLEELSKFLI